MVFALLRAFLVGATAAAGAFVITEAAIFASTSLGGPPRRASDDEAHINVILLVAIPCAIVGYATHPLAKGLPKSVQERITACVNRYANRFLVGVVVGILAALASGVVGTVGCGLLGVPLPGEPRMMAPKGRVTAPEEIERLALFVAIGTSAAAFTGSVVGGVLAPSEYEIKPGPPFYKLVAWSAILGAIAGAWFGAGAGRVVLNLAKWKRDYEPNEDMAGWIAFGTGLVAGTAAAITLRIWRNR